MKNIINNSIEMTAEDRAHWIMRKMWMRDRERNLFKRVDLINGDSKNETTN